VEFAYLFRIGHRTPERIGRIGFTGDGRGAKGSLDEENIFIRDGELFG
jgi:hypothetical protein